MVLSYVGLRADAQLESRIAANRINDQYLVTIKTAIHLPYYNNSPDYEFLSGSIEVNGVAYQYVKRRIYNDSLELKCYPNVSKAFVKNAKNELFRLTTDTPSSSRSKKPVAGKNLLPDYFEAVSVKLYTSGSSRGQCFPLFHPAAYLPVYSSVMEHPPQINAVLI